MLEFNIYTRLGCWIPVMSRFHLRPLGLTLLGAWMMVWMGRYT